MEYEVQHLIFQKTGKSTYSIMQCYAVMQSDRNSFGVADVNIVPRDEHSNSNYIYG